MGNEIKDKIISEAKRIEEDCLFSSKGHFEAARLWSSFHFWIGIPTVVIAAVAGALAFSNWPICAGILSLLVTASTAVITFVNPNEKASAHHKAGTIYNSLRSDVRLFYEVEVAQSDDSQKLTDELESVSKQRSKLGEDSPQVPRWAYQKAKTGIESGEATYQVDSSRPKTKKSR